MYPECRIFWLYAIERPATAISRFASASDAALIPQIAAIILEVFLSAKQIIEIQQEELGCPDAVAGDGDQRIGMLGGLSVALHAEKKP